MRRSVITGACGRIGRGVGAALRKHGHHVVGVDINPPPSADGTALIGTSCDTFVQCDLTAAASGSGPHADALKGALIGATTVVHCAAWPGPSAVPPPAVDALGTAIAPSIGLEPCEPSQLLRDNVAATSAVCDFAVRANVRRVVFSSSAFSMGYSHAVFGPQAYRPLYLPIDENHPPLPHETYGLSKHFGEQVLEAAARTARSMSFVSLRFTNIVKSEMWGSLPWTAPTEESPLTLLMWAYCPEEDVIDAHVQSVLRPSAAADGEHEAYFLAAPDTRFREPTTELLGRCMGLRSVVEAMPMEGNASVLDASKAARRLGFRPRSWQDDESSSDADGTLAARPLPPTMVARRLWAPSPSPAAVRARADPLLRTFDLSGFALGCGRVLPPGAHLAYRMHGPPLGEGDGLILHPTSFDCVHDEVEYNLGPEAALDTSRYTVVVVNMLGNGVSFSPSTLATSEQGAALAPYPRLITIADNVRAQHALLSALGANLDFGTGGGMGNDGKHAPATFGRTVAASSPYSLSLIYGFSMGALQAYEWAAAYPEAVSRIAAVCGASRCGELNSVFLRSLEAALTADGCYHPPTDTFRGRPTRGLEAFSSIYAGWGVGEGWYVDRGYATAGYATAEDFVTHSYLPAFAQCNPSDLLAQVRAWRAADIAVHTNGDWEAALRRMRARVLLMPCVGDKYFTLTEAKREAAVLGDQCSLVPIRSPAGHRAGDPSRPELTKEREFLTRAVRAFMEQEA